MAARYDAALIEKPFDEELGNAEKTALIELVGGGGCIGVDIDGDGVESHAIGYAARWAHDGMDAWKKAVASILGDMELESDDGEYDIDGVRVYLGRGLPEA